MSVAALPRVGIVSSQRMPADPYTWLRVHVDLGISAFYIMFEDSGDLPRQMQEYVAGLGKGKPQELVLYYETRSVDRATEKNYHDLMTRQEAWVNKALDIAASHGVDWVFHIDDDEIAFPGNEKDGVASWPEVLQRELDPSCMSVHVENLEAFSGKKPSRPFFRDPAVRYLPRECAHLYAAYANGKSASRTIRPQRAAGPHYFGPGKVCELPVSKGAIGHFEGLSMGKGDDVPPARWVEKNRLRIGNDLSKIPFQATLDGVAAVQSGDPARMREVWEKYRTVEGERFKQCKLPAVKLALPSHKYSDKDVAGP